jgi:Fuc2NAc and GlcNAc transferase
MIEVGILVGFAAAASLSGAVRRYALAEGILDYPNARSSHVTPVPRGGGLAVVGAMLVALGVLSFSGTPILSMIAIPLLGVLVVAVTGWLDDRRGLSVRARLFAHAVAALTLLPLVLVPSFIPESMGWMAIAWWLIWGVSSVNVVNFMDGLDGLVTTQASIFGLYLLLAGLPVDGVSSAFGGALMGATAGFLLWNWPPAKIFLGDVGSGTIGFAMVVGGGLFMRESGAGVVTAFLPLYPLFLDATITLVARAMRGERLGEAHRTHLYQRLANGGWGHARVTLAYATAAMAGIAVGLRGLGGSVGWVWGYFVAVPAVGFWLHRRQAASS